MRQRLLQALSLGLSCAGILKWEALSQSVAPGFAAGGRLRERVVLPRVMGLHARQCCVRAGLGDLNWR